MSTTTSSMFGASPAPEPALPGSYGEPPSGYRLPASTTTGPVTLQVADLARSLEFYEGVLGLRVIAEEEGTGLGPNDSNRVLVWLRERPGVKPAPGRGRLGLYHFAILLPDRASLGRFALHAAARGVRVGSADHVVSEAFYLNDPDGLGIEVYADRPRAMWSRVGRELVMGTDPVDLGGLVQAAGGVAWSGMPSGTTIGHLHLHVGDLATADVFYRQVIGFDRIVWRYPGAVFFSAGGYHHHLGVNTWAGSGARAAGPDEARLLEWVVEVPTVDGVRGALLATRQAFEDQGAAGMAVADPWGTVVRLRTGG